MGDRHRGIAQLALGLYEQAQVHELERRVSRRRETGSQETGLGRLQQGRILADPGMLSEVPLDLLAKARDEVSVGSVDVRAGRGRTRQQSLQIGEEGAEQSSERKSPAGRRAAELAQQHLAEAGQVGLAERLPGKSHRHGPLQEVRDTGDCAT